MCDNNESVAVPVRYFIVRRWFFGTKYYVLDTSVEGQGRTVAKCDTILDAMMVYEAMNATFGHPQGSGIA